MLAIRLTKLTIWAFCGMKKDVLIYGLMQKIGLSVLWIMRQEFHLWILRERWPT